MTSSSSTTARSDHWALNTTVRCQHRCVYCFEGDRHGHSDVPPEETRTLIDRAAEVVPSVIFMGAEPTLNPHLPELIAYARGRGLRPNISTNAIRLADAGFLQRLVDAGLRTIELSFPYPDAEVFAAVTQVRPTGFSKLLRALENVEQARKNGSRITVNANVVVSRFNVERLEEVVALVVERLVETPLAVSFKRVIPRPHVDDRDFLERIHVPLARLRRVLPAAAARVPARADPCFRDFPLCALPGVEHLDADLRYWLEDPSVSHNFEDQTRIDDMYPEAAARAPHAWQWLCDTCALDPVCLRRGLFQSGRHDVEHAPEPTVGPRPPALEQFVRAHPRRGHVLDAPPPAADPAHAALLRAVRAGLAHLSAWRPLETGLLVTGEGPAAEPFRLRPSRADPAAPIHVNGWGVTPLGTGAPRAAPAIAAVLETLEADSVTAGRDPTPPAPDARVGPPRPREWTAFLASRVAPPLAAALRNRSGNGVAVTAAGASIVWTPPGRTLPYEVRVEPAAGFSASAPIDGFLCGRLRILPERFVLNDPEGSAGVEALARALFELQTGDDLASVAPEPPRFLERAWRRYREALLPRRGTAGSLVRGRIGVDEIRLEFATADGRLFELVMVPAGPGVPACASDGVVALQYTTPPGEGRNPVVQRVIDHYAARLDPARRARTEPRRSTS